MTKELLIFVNSQKVDTNDTKMPTPKAKIFLATGFEESEALVPYDIMKRGGIDVELIGIAGKTVVSSHGVEVTVHKTLNDELGEYDLIMLPGGMPGTLNLNDCAQLKDIIRKAANDCKIISAICAGPMVLGGMGLLKGKKATCYPGFEDKLSGATVTGEQVVRDGNIITGIGAGAAYEFGLELLAALTDKTTAEKIKRQIMMK